MNKRRLFISQPMSGRDDNLIAKQREALYKIYCLWANVDPQDVELINQHMPVDEYDSPTNFPNEIAHNLYRFCRSIGMMGKATDIILYGDWEKSRGCRLEVEILKKFEWSIPIIDQKTLIDFCIEKNMMDELEILWPTEFDKLHITITPKIPKLHPKRVTCPACVSRGVSDNEIIISKFSDLPSEGQVMVLRYPTDGRSIILNIKVADAEDTHHFPYIETCPEMVYVSLKTACELGMDIGTGEPVIIDINVTISAR